MAKMNPSDMLEEQIAHLKQKRDTDLLALKYQLHETGESLKPANLVKSVAQDVANNDQVRSLFKKAMLGLVVGLLAKRMLTKKKNKKPINLLGTAMKLGVNLFVSNRYQLLKSVGAMAVSAIASSMINKRRKKQLAKSLNEETSPDSSSDVAYSMR